MKILHVLHAFPPEFVAGGTERTVEALARAMQAAGHEVTVLAGSVQPGRSLQLVEDRTAGLRVLRLRRGDLHFESWEKAWSPEVGRGFRALLRAERPDVVHVHHWLRLSSDLLRIARQEQIAVVACTLHDYWTQLGDPVRPYGLDAPEPPPAPPWMNAAERREAFAVHRADLLDELRAAHLRFAPSRAQADGLQQLADGPLGAVVVLPPPLLERPPRRAEPAGERGRRLLFWGSIYPEKGLEVVFDALFSVQDGWELHVFGEAHDPVYGERLRRRAVRMPVHFHGGFDSAALTDAPGDYAVLASTCHESYGLVLDEARCLGLPVIASDLPAFREHCDPASSVFFAPNDPGSLAMALLDAASLASLPSAAAPPLWGGDEAAAATLERYAEAAAGEHSALDLPRALPERRRAAMLFRRAERRLWSLLQHADPRCPPDDVP